MTPLTHIFSDEDILEVVANHLAPCLVSDDRHFASLVKFGVADLIGGSFLKDVKQLSSLSHVNKALKHTLASRISTLTKAYLLTERCEFCKQRNIVSVQEVSGYCWGCRSTMCICTYCQRSADFCDSCEREREYEARDYPGYT